MWRALRAAAAQLAGHDGRLPVSPLACLRRVDQRWVVVRRDDLHPGLRGGLRLIGDRWVIVLNRRDGPRRARFTLAHELGHILLGEGTVAPPRRLPSRVREALCDAFAAELLMPATPFARARARQQDVPALARRFDVSASAAVRRVRELGRRRRA